MLIAGSRGFAKQLLHSLPEEDTMNVQFFDNVNLDTETLYDKFPVLHTEAQARCYFDNIDRRFALGIGNPAIRIKLAELLQSWGGILTSTISRQAYISKYGVFLEDGINILSGVVVEPDVTIGKGCLINLNVSITHESHVGDFVEIGPGAMLLGNCCVGCGCFIGAGAIILPKIKVGNHVVIGAGAVVTKDIPDSSTIKGIPAR